MYCSHCGQRINDNDKFCFACGSRVGHIDAVSSSTYQPQNTYQAQYTSPKIVYEEPEEPPYLDGYNPHIIALVCFLLGGIGIHNFIMGEARKGIFRLLTCWLGIGVILALIDFIKIVAWKYEINPRKFI